MISNKELNSKNLKGEKTKKTNPQKSTGFRWELIHIWKQKKGKYIGKYNTIAWLFSGQQYKKMPDKPDC